jgi:Obg family GTPase CgtA-like protein
MAHATTELTASDVAAYLDQHEHKSMLRFITCGSVDDGKSTLIGRLLYETHLVFEDHLAALELESKTVGTQGGELDFALLLDGLSAEREQGITIDVAYRFFSTERRKFIVADTPGHEQYTRNMVTGASTADLAVILVDARKGVLTQTRRHSYLVSLLGIRHVVVAVNKLDLDAAQAAFPELKRQLEGRGRPVVGISAATGDGVPGLLEVLRAELARLPAEPARATPNVRVYRLAPEAEGWTVEREEDGSYIVRGRRVERMAAMTDPDSPEGVEHLQRSLGRLGVVAALEQAGAQPGDLVRIGPIEVEWGE